jgi:hypothetical protein
MIVSCMEPYINIPNVDFLPHSSRGAANDRVKNPPRVISHRAVLGE